MKSEDFAAELHRAEFNRQPINDAPNFELALHRKKPTGSDQTEFELQIPGYARVSVPRDAEHWTVDERRVSNVKEIAFPPMQPKDKAKTVWYLSIGIGGRIRRTVVIPGEPTFIPSTYPSEISFPPGSISIRELPADSSSATAKCVIVVSAAAYASSSESGRAQGRSV